MANLLLRGISACEGGTPQKAEVWVSSLYEKIAVLFFACAAMVSAALGDARWYAGDGCLTDLEKWTEKPHVRLRHRRHGDRLLLESVGCDGTVDASGDLGHDERRNLDGGDGVADDFRQADLEWRSGDARDG